MHKPSPSSSLCFLVLKVSLRNEPCVIGMDMPRACPPGPWVPAILTTVQGSFPQLIRLQHTVSRSLEGQQEPGSATIIQAKEHLPSTTTIFCKNRKNSSLLEGTYCPHHKLKQKPLSENNVPETSENQTHPKMAEVTHLGRWQNDTSRFASRLVYKGGQALLQ
jgi:hypothetical protein